MVEATEQQQQQGQESFVEEPPYIKQQYVQQQQDSLWKEIINKQKILRFIELTLGGYVYDEDKELWTKKYTSLLNKEGLGDLMIRLYGYCHYLTSCSNYKDDEIRDRMKIIRKEIAKFIGFSGPKIGLSDANYDFVLNFVNNNIESAFRGALGAGERKALSTTHHVSEQFIQRPLDMQQRKGGFFNFFKK